jgi:UrcA family protein
LESLVPPSLEEVIMNSTGKRRALVGIAALAAVATVNLASAAPEGDEPQSVVVRYADLDPSRPEDARRLYSRIKRAARKVCYNSPSSNLDRLIIYEECLEQAITAAVDKVRSEQVSAILRAHNPRAANR